MNFLGRSILNSALVSALFLSGISSPAQAQNLDPAALLGQGDTSAVQGMGIQGFSGRLQGLGMGGQTGIPVLSPKPDTGAQDTALRQMQGQMLPPPKPEAPNQFQRFVQASTGKSLPIYGANLFSNPQAYFPDAAAPAPAEYVLGPGDEIRIQVWGAVEFTGSQTLDRNGQINLPRVGTIPLAGVQVKDLESTLSKKIASIYKNVNVTASLGKLRAITVYVVGHARQPGSYNLNSLSTLINAVFASGGPSANGSMRNIELKRASQTVTTLDLYAFMSKGDKSKDVALQPGDVISIAPAGPRIALTGVTDHSAIYELKPGNSVQDILALGGGLPSLTKPQMALLERLNTVNENNPRQVKPITLDAQGQRTVLQDGDVLTLLPINPSFQNAVTLRGNVATPLRHIFKPGMRVADLIPEPNALVQDDYYIRKNRLVQFEKGNQVTDDRVLNEVKNLLEEINWDYALVERLNLKEVRTDLIPFNLGRALRDKNPSDNLELLAGDIVTIFGVKDVPVPMEKRSRFVNVGGEVKVPGIYQVQPGETLAQVVQRAGGLTAHAYAFGSIFSRDSNRRQQQANLEQAVRRMESDLVSQAATLAQNTTEAEKSSTQAQVAAQRGMVERLKQLKANGRVALEMDPAQPVFPEILLEDGDQLIIPNKPSFVSVFGAVLGETSFIWRARSTVGNYIDRAGPTRYADLDGALIIRADGTVQANEAQRSFVGWGNRSFMSRVLQPGDSVFIPEQVDRRTAYTQFIQGAKDWTQLFYQFGLGAAAIKTLRGN
jgi:protein involved in polysaccharide export with SLBB domain